MTHTRLAARAAPLLLATLAACGGGDGAELTIHLTGQNLIARCFHGQRYGVNTLEDPLWLGVSGTVDPVPMGPIYVRVVLDAPIIIGDVQFVVEAPNRFTFSFQADTDLPVGTHTGTIELQVFRDAAMRQPYAVAGGTLHYSLTVDPELTITVKIDGVEQAETFSSSHFAVTDFVHGSSGYISWLGIAPAPSFTLDPGQVVELESSLPVTWWGPDHTSGLSSGWYEPPVVTDTTLTMTMPDVPQGLLLPDGAFLAMPAGSAQFGGGFTFQLRSP